MSLPPESGDCTLYTPSGSDDPPWPAIVCTEDMAPKNLEKPHGYWTLLLLMGKLEFCWALPRELLVYEPLTEAESSSFSEELRFAHKMVLDSFADMLGLDHWKSTVAARDGLGYSSDSDLDPGSDSGSDACHTFAPNSDSDPDIVKAKRLSLADSERKRASSDSSANLEASSPKKRRATATRPPLSSPINANQRPRLNAQSRPSEPPIFKLLNVHRRTSTNAVYPGTIPHLWESSSLDRNEANSDNPESLRGKRQGPSEFAKDAKKTSLPVDADIDDHVGFVEFCIGPEGPAQEKFHIAKHDVLRRGYFSNPGLGISFLTERGNSWSFERPCLRGIKPDDFRYAAEFLSTEHFGHQIIENDVQRAEAFSECAGAWTVADELGMDDLLDYTVKKMENTKPWELEETLAFASIVYKTEGALLRAYKLMKEGLADYVASHYLEYLRESPSAFGSHMTQMPEFLDNVHRKRAEMLGPAQEEVQSDDLEQIIEEEPVEGAET